MYTVSGVVAGEWRLGMRRDSQIHPRRSIDINSRRELKRHDGDLISPIFTPYNGVHSLYPVPGSPLDLIACESTSDPSGPSVPSGPPDWSFLGSLSASGSEYFGDNSAPWRISQVGTFKPTSNVTDLRSTTIPLLIFQHHHPFMWLS